MSDVNFLDNLLLNEVRTLFPKHTVRIGYDPDDSSIKYLELYDVQPECVKQYKKILWEIIESVKHDQEILYIPHITRHDDTVKYYSEYLKEQ